MLIFWGFRTTLRNTNQQTLLLWQCTFMNLNTSSMEIVFVLHFLYMHAHEQLTGTQFSKVVCPLFQHYSRFNLTHQSLSEDDSRLTNISLITFLTKKLAKTSCNYVSFTHYSSPVRKGMQAIINTCIIIQVKANCTENQQCSTMNCSISSLASLCLRTPSPRDIMDEIRSYTPPVYGNTAEMVESWLREILQSRSEYPDRSVLDTLISVLHVTSLIRCNIPEDAPANQIRCYWDY